MADKEKRMSEDNVKSNPLEERAASESLKNFFGSNFAENLKYGNPEIFDCARSFGMSKSNALSRVITFNPLTVSVDEFLELENPLLANLAEFIKHAEFNPEQVTGNPVIILPENTNEELQNAAGVAARLKNIICTEAIFAIKTENNTLRYKAGLPEEQYESFQEKGIILLRSFN